MPYSMNIFTGQLDLVGSGGGGGGGGTVTSVGLADGSTTPIFAITGSPVTGTGTLTETLIVQPAHAVLVGPISGSAQPTFRVLVAGDIPSLSAVYVTQSEVGAANGVASLDSSGKIPSAQLPSTVLQYEGLWNPVTNTPTLQDSTGTNGYVYQISTAFAGPIVGLNNSTMVNFQVGNLVIYSATLGQWQQADALTGVTSVNGAQGAVTVNAINQLTGDITAGPAVGSQEVAATLTATTNATLTTLSSLSLPYSQLTGTPSLSGFATTTLNNLGTTAVNANINPGTNATFTLGTTGLTWSDVLSQEFDVFNGTTFIGSLSYSSNQLELSAQNGIVLNTSSGNITLNNPIVAAQYTGYLYGNGGSTISASTTIPYSAITGGPSTNAITALTGDGTATGPGSAALTLATVNSNVGSFGSSTSIPSFTVNAKGLITAASGNVVVAPAGTLSGTTLNSSVVTSSLTSVSTITSGTWTGTTIAIANGGTGQTSASAAYNVLSPMTTTGDLEYEASPGVAARLPIGTTGQVLTVAGGIPAWAAAGATTTPNKETFVLSSTDITHQYLDLAHVARTNSIIFMVQGSGYLLEGTSYDYSVSYTGGVGSNTRITFLNDLATGGNAALVAGDVVQVNYSY